jgi:hypothetical protein
MNNIHEEKKRKHLNKGSALKGQSHEKIGEIRV